MLHDDLNVRKKGPSCPGKKVDGITLYEPAGTSSNSKYTNPDLK